MHCSKQCLFKKLRNLIYNFPTTADGTISLWYGNLNGQITHYNFQYLWPYIQFKLFDISWVGTSFSASRPKRSHINLLKIQADHQ